MSDAVDRVIRVVLADDHDIVRHGIRGFLTEAPNIQVIAEASDGTEALRLIEDRRPDVAVLDIQMPGLTGIEVARRVRDLHLPVGLLILTAYDDDPFLMAALEAGVTGFVLKNAQVEEIVNAVYAVYEGKSVLDVRVVPKLMQAIAAAAQPHTVYEELTGRELEVLRLVASGLTNRAIGVRLGISDRTAQGHLRNIFEKLHAANRTEAVIKAVQLGLLDVPE